MWVVPVISALLSWRQEDHEFQASSRPIWATWLDPVSKHQKANQPTNQLASKKPRAGCSLVEECLPSLHKALASIPSTAKKVGIRLPRSRLCACTEFWVLSPHQEEGMCFVPLDMHLLAPMANFASCHFSCVSTLWGMAAPRWV
jgi:hypothetical protein